MRYLATAHVSQVAHAFFSMTDGLNSAHSLPNRGVIHEMAARGSFNITNRNRYFVFMTTTITTTECPVSHKYVVTGGSKTFIALSDKLE
jgi:hypothetical protein